jgi:calmodulin
LNEKQIARFKRAFSLCDPRSEGVIPTAMLGAVMRSVGQNPSEADLIDMINELDADARGSVDFLQFLKLMVGKPNENDFEEELCKICRGFDRDGNGFVTLSDMRQILMSLGERISDQDIDEWLSEGEVDDNSQLNYEEFIKILISK